MPQCEQQSVHNLEPSTTDRAVEGSTSMPGLKKLARFVSYPNNLGMYRKNGTKRHEITLY